MQKSTFKLTKPELDFISDPQWMSLKQKLIRTISDSLHGLGQQIMHEYYAGSGLNYKVTRGENYLDMPYLVLDAPQLKNDALAGKLRIMFWWGHYISLQLFVRTETLAKSNLNNNDLSRYFILISDNLFTNDLESSDFIKLSAFNHQISPGQEITKVCMKVELDEMENLELHLRGFMSDFRVLAGG